MTNGDLARGERLQIMLSPEELEALDNFRFKHRMPSRAAAVRDLLRMGLASVGIDAEAGRKSGSFGVLASDGNGMAGEPTSKG
jgi:metal-responsive CopG/Arc/MetJ family transcriptional regulator